MKTLPHIDLTDVYDDTLSHEIETYRRFTSIFIDQIFVRHFIQRGLIREKPLAELVDPDFHPSPTAYHFTRKLLEYYLDRGSLAVTEGGYLSLEQEIVDEDPDDDLLNRFLDNHPEKTDFFGILRNIRDVVDKVLFDGEDALLTLANDNFRQAMKLWESLMLTARVKQPCHQLILRALRSKALSGDSITVFEGGAGVGSVIRDGLNDPGFVSILEKVNRYYFTDICLSLIKMGREALRKRLPSHLFSRFEFRTANLDNLLPDADEYTFTSSMDLIILEHVLYDVIDLDKTLRLFHGMLKPGGYLVFSLAFRTRPRNFFVFEYLQSTFQSYHHARLEPGFREHIGYLTLEEWRRSLHRVGFETFRAWPEACDLGRWPYGGIIAIPSK